MQQPLPSTPSIYDRFGNRRGNSSDSVVEMGGEGIEEDAVAELGLAPIPDNKKEEEGFLDSVLNLLGFGSSADTDEKTGRKSASESRARQKQ